MIEFRQHGNQACGCRRVRRCIQRQAGKTVNPKAVLRVIRKPNLLAQIRRRRAYAQCAQAIRKYPDLLQHVFEQPIPNEFWVTDITYIPTPNGMLHMCAVLDLCARKVLAYLIGNDAISSLVTQPIRDAMEREQVTVGLASRSDQGAQYTSQTYFDPSQECQIPSPLSI